MQIDRFLNVATGTIMVVTDLHGDGEAFKRCVDTFLAMREMGEADRLIFLGDIVHGYGLESEDASLTMIMRIMELRKQLGEDKVIMLLGNHEMPHIYGVSLAKGNMEFTPRFEWMLGKHRDTVIEFFKTLPLVVRTGAGVLLSHAGPDDNSINRAERLRHFDHNVLLRDADQNLAQQSNLEEIYENYSQISGQSYEELSRKYLAVTGRDDPRYSHLMRALFIADRDHRFGVLWDFLFTQNERGLTNAAYELICQRYLDTMGRGAPTEQRVCVSGHIVVPQGGYQIINERHLRLASAAHARPREEGRYLMLDTKQPIRRAEDLIPHVYKVF